MMLREVVRFAIRGLVANRMRSVLTMLGIFIGVAAVVVLTAVGNGAGQAISATVSSFGANTITVFADTTTSSDEGRDIRPRELTIADARALEDPEGAPAIARAAPIIQMLGVEARYGYSSHRIETFFGATPSYLDIAEFAVVEGSTLSEDDLAGARQVVLLGRTVADELFGGADPLGERVMIAGAPFTVAGVIVERGEIIGQDIDNLAFVPITSLQQSVTGYGPVDAIIAQATGPDQVNAAEAQILSVLDARYGITDPDDRTYQIFNQATLLDAISTITGLISALLAAIAGISLLVGGVGITNIMLMTVTERTREIGIRKAIGAPRGAILGQFLLEATMLSLFGGGLGVLAGVAVSSIHIGAFQPVVMPSTIVLAFGVTFAIGIFFGAHPANRAAKLRPIDALRYE
ncbi:MAG: ABC transporter permease [Nitriliruptoraceae bacterium]